MAKDKLPGEHHKRSLVTVVMDRLEASVFAPARLKALDELNPGRQLHDPVGVGLDYIVKSHRVEGVWTHTVEHQGVTTFIPAKVLERLISQRDSIIHDERSARSKAAAEARLKRVARSDQKEAAEEPPEFPIYVAWDGQEHGEY